MHIAVRSGQLVAVSELGDTLVWNLGVLLDGYCRLMRRVWDEVSVVWDDGMPLRRVPPPDHRCRPGRR